MRQSFHRRRNRCRRQLSRNRISVSKTEQFFQSFRQFYLFRSQVFLQVTGNFRLAAECRQTVDESKQLHPQSRASHRPIHQFVVPTHLVLQLTEKGAFFVLSCLKNFFSNFLSFGFVDAWRYLCDHWSLVIDKNEGLIYYFTSILTP